MVVPLYLFPRKFGENKTKSKARVWIGVWPSLHWHELNICWFHHSLGSGPWCYPFAMAIVLEVCTLSCTLVMCVGQSRGTHVSLINILY